MSADDAELFGLFRAGFTINGSKNFIIGCFHVFRSESRHIGEFFWWICEYVTDDVWWSPVEDISKCTLKFPVRNGKTVLYPILFSRCKVRKFCVITNQIQKLTDPAGGIKLPETKSCSKISAINFSSFLSIFLLWIALTYLGCVKTILQLFSRILYTGIKYFPVIPYQHPYSCLTKAKITANGTICKDWEAMTFVGGYSFFAVAIRHRRNPSEHPSRSKRDKRFWS